MKDFFSDLLYGKIVFRAENGFCELFLSLCKKEGTVLKNVKRSSDSLEATVRRFELESVFSSAAKSGMNINILSRHGLPDVFIRYRKRFGIPLGILTFFLITGILCSFVWSVDISGIERIPAESFSLALEETGIVKGAFCGNIQCDDAEFVLYNRFPELLWVNVYRAGSRVFITAREREDMSFENENIYSNIIAAKSGEIVRADIFSGEGELYPGTAVVKGDLLVSGVDTFRDGGVRFLDSKAEIWARTKNHINSSAAKEIEAMKTESCKDNYLLYFFGLRIPLTFGGKTEDFTENGYYVSSLDVVFPLGLIRQQYKSLSKSRISMSDEQATLMAFFDFSRASFRIYEKATVLERKISITTDSQVTVGAEYLCIEDIAEKKSFTVEEEESSLR